MAIQVGDRIPSVNIKRLGSGGMEDVSTGDVFGPGRKVVLFAVPGAYTPTCSNKHLPGYIEKASELRSKGVDDIVCLAVNDPFVMQAWGSLHGANGKVTLLPDGNGEFTKALGLEMDGSGAGLGTRSKRFSMVVEDGVVKSLEVESNPSELGVSGAEVCLRNL